jgi:hypothetical protein
MNIIEVYRVMAIYYDDNCEPVEMFKGNTFLTSITCARDTTLSVYLG